MARLLDTCPQVMFSSAAGYKADTDSARRLSRPARGDFFSLPCLGTFISGGDRAGIAESGVVGAGLQ
jgi:hypothetical protein